MKMKKHTIKILSDSSSSAFVTDLRSQKKKMTAPAQDSADFDFKPAPAKISNDFKQAERIVPLPFQESGRKSDWTTWRETFFWPFLSLFFKVIRAVFFFFFDWALDIFSFFKKMWRRIGFKPIRRKDRPRISPTKISGEKIDFRLNEEYFRPRRPVRSLIAFALLLLLLVLPFKIFSYYHLALDKRAQDDLKEYSWQALANFTTASGQISELDLSSAQNNFFQAGQNFLLLDQAAGKIDELVLLLSNFSNQPEIKLAAEAKKIAQTGLFLSSAGDNLALAVNSLIAVLAKDDNRSDFSDFYHYAQKTGDDFKQANKYLKRIKDKNIPADYRDQLAAIKQQADLVEKSWSLFLSVIPELRDFLAIDGDRRYLLVFQNNAELRASGGFIGSYALIDVGSGRIKNIEIPAGGSYDTAGGLKTLVKPPEPLRLVKPVWYFWDANWWPDWKLSAQNLSWFYEQSGGPSVDGVIAITPDVLENLLEVIGPIDLNRSYGVVIGSDNFSDIIQEIVEVIGQPELYQDRTLSTDILSRLASTSDQFQRQEPKKIIGDLMTEILNKISANFNQKLLLDLSRILADNLNSKNILLYFSNEALQAEAEKLSWAGRIKTSPLDYLLVVNSNIAGGKTDKVINDRMSLSVKIKADGSIVNRLTIKRQHQGRSGDLFTGVRNVNWLRVYVPLGSVLISARGFSDIDQSYFKEAEASSQDHKYLKNTENQASLDPASQTRIYQESGRTVFANWSLLDPGQESDIEIEYRLPYNFQTLFPSETKTAFWPWSRSLAQFKNYSLLWQKQSGHNRGHFDFSLSSELSQPIVWTYPDQTAFSSSGLTVAGDLSSDKYLVAIFD